jgi:hypothetical protein
MGRFAEITLAFFSLALMHWGFYAGAGRIRRGFRKLASPPVHSRRNRELSADKRGKARPDEVPPLENPHLD